FAAPIVRVLFLLVACLALAGGASAQIGDEERQRIREEMREHWRQLAPEDKQRIRQEHRERRESRQQMSPDERSRFREELRGRRDATGGQNFGHRGGGRH
ncbi:MAG: hypothetical protein PHV02_15820, partial [Rhodocyclaceae bacterium]|nr:hypothetical protein [Rhodocyclaceae bacterium]